MCNSSPSVLFLKIEKLLRKTPVPQFSFFHKAERLQPAIFNKSEHFRRKFFKDLTKTIVLHP